MKERTVCPKVRHYIETEILPRYEKLPGHSLTHIRNVIERSLLLARQIEGDIDIDKVYVIAAYHDLGREIDNETHHLCSGKLLRSDTGLAELFLPEDIEIMAQAVEDHRASLKPEPRSIYGKIVSSADRSYSIDEILERAYDYNTYLHPEMSEEDRIEEIRKILRRKYSPDGYAADKIYFFKSEYKAFLRRVEEITENPVEFRHIQQDFNRRRGISG